jgi:hypothetical protein
VGIGGDQSDTTQAAADELAEKGPPELQVLGRADIDPHHFTFAGGLDSSCDEDRHRDHATVFAHLLEGGVEHQVGVLGVQSAGPEGGHLAVELLAVPADLVLGDALQAERFGQAVDRPSRDAVDVGLLDHCQQRPLMPTPGLQQAREVGALAELGDLKVDGADPGVPLPLPVAVAVGQPVLAPLMEPGSRQLGHLGVHQLLGEQAHAVTEKARVSALLVLVEQV